MRCAAEIICATRVDAGDAIIGAPQQGHETAGVSHASHAGTRQLIIGAGSSSRSKRDARRARKFDSAVGTADGIAVLYLRPRCILDTMIGQPVKPCPRSLILAPTPARFDYGGALASWRQGSNESVCSSRPRQ